MRVLLQNVSKCRCTRSSSKMSLTVSHSENFEGHPAPCLNTILESTWVDIWVSMTISYNHYLWKLAWGHAGLQRKVLEDGQLCLGRDKLIFKCALFSFVFTFQEQKLHIPPNPQLHQFFHKEEAASVFSLFRPLSMKEKLRSCCTPTHCWPQGNHLMS